MVGSAKREINLASVVFPEPEDPTNAMCCRAGTNKVIFRRTGKSSSCESSRELYAKLKSRNSMLIGPFGIATGFVAAGGPVGVSSTLRTLRNPATAV